MTVWLRGVHTPAGARVDVGLDRGVISAVGAATVADGDEVHVLDGYLLVPSFVEPHAHLDKALTVSRSTNRTGDLVGAITAMNEIADGFTRSDFAARAEAALAMYLAHGTTTIRSHVNVGGTFGMRALEALVEVRERWRGTVDLELAALPGHPLGGTAGADLRHAMAAGADVVGGCPHLDEDPLGSVAECLQVAADFGAPLDLHTDETLDPRLLTLDRLADLVRSTGFLHPVVAGHCVSLSMQPPDVQRRVAENVAAAGIAIIALPQTNLYLQGYQHPVGMPRGLTAVGPLLAAGAVVAAGGDNLRDAFHPVGRADALEVAALMVTSGHLSVSGALDSVTVAGRRALRRPAVAIEVGAPADLVAVRASDVADAVGAASPDRAVFVGGRLVSRTTVTTTTAVPVRSEVPA